MNRGGGSQRPPGPGLFSGTSPSSLQMTTDMWRRGQQGLSHNNTWNSPQGPRLQEGLLGRHPSSLSSFGPFVGIRPLLMNGGGSQVMSRSFSQGIWFHNQNQFWAGCTDQPHTQQSQVEELQSALKNKVVQQIQNEQTMADMHAIIQKLKRDIDWLNVSTHHEIIQLQKQLKQCQEKLEWKEKVLCKTRGVLDRLQGQSGPEDQADQTGEIGEEGPNFEYKSYLTGQKTEVETSERDPNNDDRKVEIPKENLVVMSALNAIPRELPRSDAKRVGQPRSQRDQADQTGEIGEEGPNCKDKSYLTGQKTEVEMSERDPNNDDTKVEIPEENLVVMSALNAMPRKLPRSDAKRVGRSRGAIVRESFQENQRLRSDLKMESDIQRYLQMKNENSELRRQLFWQRGKSEMLEDENEDVRLENKKLSDLCDTIMQSELSN